MKARKILSLILAVAMIIGTISTVAFAQADTDIYKVGATEAFATISDAKAVAADADGDGQITYEIYGQVFIPANWFDPSVSGVTKVNFVGGDNDAELIIGEYGPSVICPAGTSAVEEITFTNLICSRRNAANVGDYGFSNVYFTTWLNKTANGTGGVVTYTNCVFPDGSHNNQYGTTNYIGCTFSNQVESNYNLWIGGKGSSNTVVTDCTFVGARGVKTYAEGADAITDVTIANTTFTGLYKKPAIVTSQMGTVEVTETTFEDCTYGAVANEKGNCASNAVVTIDGKAPQYVASWDNNYYTNMDYAVKEAGSETDVTAVKLCVDGVCYSDVIAAFKAIKADSVVDFLADVTYEGRWDCRNNSGTACYGTMTAPVTINGNGHTFKIIGNIDDGYNHYSVFRFTSDATVNGLTFDLSEAKSVFQERIRAISSEGGNLSVTDCKFIGSNYAKNKTCAVMYGETNKDDASAVANAEIYISGCTFEGWRYGVIDGENKKDVAVVVVEKSVFEDSHIHVSASEEVTITGNTMDNGYVKVASYTYPNDLEVTVLDNTLDESMGSDNAIHCGAVINAQDELVKPVVKAGDYHYSSLSTALSKAADGDVIDLLGNTFEINANKDNYLGGKSLTFKNGTLDFTYAGAGTAFFWLNAGDCLKFENVNLIKKDVDTNAKYMYNLFGLHAPDASLYFTDCTIDFDGKKTTNAEGKTVGMASSYIANDGGGKIFFTNCDIESEYTNLVYLGGVTFDNCTYDGYANLDEGDVAGNILYSSAYPSTIKDSVVNTRRLGIYSFPATYALNPINIINSDITAQYVGSYDGDIDDEAEMIVVDKDSTVKAVELDMGVISPDSEGVITSEADYVYVQYKKVDIDEATSADTLEGADKYQIILVGANSKNNGEIINELASADLTFDFRPQAIAGGALTYAVEPAADVSLAQIGDRYMFNYNGAKKYEETGAAIVIGTITIEGYGSYELYTDTTVDTNAVYATEIKDSIVDGFESASELVLNADMKSGDGMDGKIEGAVIEIPTRELEVQIDFNNAADKNVIDYQDMTVVVSGGDLAEEIVIELGDTTYTTDLDIFGKSSAKYTVDAGADNKYIVTVSGALASETTYTVTVKGAGYRTVRKNITMSEDAAADNILTYWNNVKDADGADFLAGDIVKDNTINVYDLSAVVSYFGKANNTNAESKFAKYDLNRDGKIDSKDVAYVLVSWGK